MAVGDILAYLNSDDLYFPWTIATVVDTFNRHPDSDFVFGDAINIDDRTGRQLPLLAPPFDLDHIRRVGFLTQPTVFWRRRVHDAVGLFDESLRFVADCDFWMRAGANHRFRKVNEFLAIERNHDGTLREAQATALEEELARVRGRYVTTHGPYHEHRVKLHAVRGRLWHRVMRMELLVSAVTPSSSRHSGWKRYLAEAGDDLSRLAVGLAIVPVVGRLLGKDLLRRDRRWLSPAASNACCLRKEL
jgi:hypothetical protein